MQHILASHGRKGVEVESDDEVGIIGKESCELVVEILLVEVQLVELCKVEREVLVHIIIYSSGVGGIVYGSVGLYQRFAREEVLVFGVFCHRDVEVAVDALVFLKLQMGPLPVVDKLLECLLQVVEYGIVRALYLSMVDGDFGLQLRALAFSSLCVVFASLVVSVPIYYLWRYQGIVGVLVLQSLAQMLLSLRYSSRHYPYRVSFSAKFLGRGIHVVRLGLAFVVAGLMSSGAEFLIRAYINRIGELSDVGLFNAGWTLAVVYAGLVFSAMEADYFPRLSSVKEMGVEQNDCVNKQLEINVLLMGPILTGMILALPVLIPLLYDHRFLDVLGMAQLAAVSMLFRAVYIPIEYLPLSKGQSRKFLCQEAVCVMLLIVMEIAGYRYKGLLGLGFGIVGAYLI